MQTCFDFFNTALYLYSRINHCVNFRFYNTNIAVEKTTNGNPTKG